MAHQKRAQILLRTRPSLKKRLFKLAKKRGITPNALMLTILNTWIEEHRACNGNCGID